MSRIKEQYISSQQTQLRRRARENKRKLRGFTL